MKTFEKKNIIFPLGENTFLLIPEKKWKRKEELLEITI